MLTKHSSFIVMGLGAFSIFITNLGFKSIMDVNEYYQYSIIITVLSLLGSFGALGIEQVFLRLATIKDLKIVVIDIKLINASLMASLLTTALASCYLLLIVELDINFVTLLLLCSGVIYVMLLYNVFRLGSEFVISQLVQNSWKLLLGILALCFFVSKVSFDYILPIVVFIWIVIFLSIYFLIRSKRVRLSRNLTYKEILLHGFYFFLALSTLSFLAQGDRVIIEHLFTKQEFGDYFYLATFFLFPYSLLQSYVGFKELVNIKNENLNLKRKLKTIIIGSILFSVFLLFLGYLLSTLNILKFNFNSDLPIILMFTIIGNVKMVYSLFSAIIAVKSNIGQIKMINIYFIAAILLCFTLFYFVEKTPFSIILLFTILWLIRLGIWSFYSIFRTRNEKRFL